VIKILYTSSPACSHGNFPPRGKEACGPKLKEVVMKRLTWIVLFSYTLLMFRPVMPVVMDVLAHTFWEQQHLLVVHEVNGKFHVHNELVNISHESGKDKQANTAKYQMQECIPVSSLLVHSSLKKTIIEDTYPAYHCFYPFSSFDSDSPPPKI
jgi:hypothetical protein